VIFLAFVPPAGAKQISTDALIELDELLLFIKTLLFILFLCVSK